MDKIVKYDNWNLRKLKLSNKESLKLLFNKEFDLIELILDIRILHGRYQKSKYLYSVYDSKEDCTLVLSYTNFGDIDLPDANLKLQIYKGNEFKENANPILQGFIKKGFGSIKIQSTKDFYNVIKNNFNN